MSSFPLFSPLSTIGDLVSFEPRLTKRSISDQTKRMIRQLKIQSGQTQVCDRMERHQHWKRHDKLQKKSKKYCATGMMDRMMKKMMSIPSVIGEGSQNMVFRDRLKEIIRLIGLSMGISR